MRNDLMCEKKLLNFYKEFVSLIHNGNAVTVFLEQAFVTMLFGHEFGSSHLNQRRSYELLLIMDTPTERECGDISVRQLTYPFNLIDNDEYYTQLVSNNFLLIRELFVLMRLAGELENKDDNSIAIQLLRMKNSNCIAAFDNFYKLKDILRTGWIRRNVDEKYLESDAMHIMQMMAFASAYFTIFKPDDLDYNKVMEMILIHEVGEVLAGDIPEGDLLHNSKHEIEAKGVRETFSKLDSGEYFINLWEEFESKSSSEAMFVYELDKFDPIVKAEYLDSELGRTDLLPDFYGYEEKRGTFKDGRLKKVFKCLEEKINI